MRSRRRPASRPRRSGGSPPSSRRRRSREPIALDAALDRRLGPAARADGRAAGQHARDARHLGPRQRLPHLPRAASPADPARHASMCRAAFATSRRSPSRSRRRPSPPGKPGQVAPGQPLPGPPLGFPTGPEDLLVEADGSPRRIDKAFSWEAPLAAHGMMHMVITNASQRRSLPDRHAVHVHGQHGLELGHERRAARSRC